MDYLDLVDDLAETDTHGAGNHGFTEGNAGTVPRSLVRATFLNAVLREILATIEGAGITPSSASNVQLLAAITSLAVHPACSGYFAIGTYTTTATLDLGLGVNAPAAAFTLTGGNTVAFPSTGIYEITLSAHCDIDSAADPTTAQIAVKLAGVTQDTISGIRYSTNTAAQILVRGTIYVTITNIATQTLTFANGTLFDMSDMGGGSQFYVKRIRK